MATQPASIGRVQQFVESWWNGTPGAKGIICKGSHWLQWDSALYFAWVTRFSASERSPPTPCLKCKKGQSRELCGRQVGMNVSWKMGSPWRLLQLNKSLLMNWVMVHACSHCRDKVPLVSLLQYLHGAKSICVLPQLSCSTDMVAHSLVVTQPPLSTSQMLSSSGQKSEVLYSWHRIFFPLKDGMGITSYNRPLTACLQHH